MERLEAEVQIAPAADTPPDVTDGQGLDELVASRLTAEAKGLIERLLDGSEPYGRDLKSWEPQKFTPQHINICVFRSIGLKGAEIARMMEMDQSRISVILGHPYGVKLVRALVPRQAVKVLDIRTKMELYADDLLERLHDKGMNEEDTSKLTAVTFGLLDRSGFGIKQEPSRGGSALGGDPSVLRRIAGALEGSKEIDAVVMPNFQPKPPPDDGSLPQDREVIGSSTPENAVAPVAAAGGRR